MDTPLEISAADSPYTSQEEDPLPLVLKILVCFLTFDAIERMVGLGQWVIERASVEGLTISEFDPSGPVGVASLGLWILVDLLLVVLILLRTWWGRMWTQTIFTIHLLHIGTTIVISKPELWLYLDAVGRLRLTLTLVVDLFFVVYLTSEAAKRVLRR
jgi:hypothetical protein